MPADLGSIAHFWLMGDLVEKHLDVVPPVMVVLTTPYLPTPAIDALMSSLRGGTGRRQRAFGEKFDVDASCGEMGDTDVSPSAVLPAARGAVGKAEC
ncbi:hypothetical protein DFJ73DRAFT_777862 [Zopfochytrium polystomum]|nr:hypothetical protein DFJ73DRAFT_777862 [Zopfochytrium polystomum]